MRNGNSALFHSFCDGRNLTHVHVRSHVSPAGLLIGIQLLVGGSNLGQTQVELSGLNRVFHELGEWLSTYEYTDRLACQVTSPPTLGGL